MCRLTGWVCLGETRVFVCLLSVLMSCVRSSSGWVRPARMGSGPSQSVIWHVYCEYIIILYNLQGTIMSAK